MFLIKTCKNIFLLSFIGAIKQSNSVAAPSTILSLINQKHFLKQNLSYDSSDDNNNYLSPSSSTLTSQNKTMTSSTRDHTVMSLLSTSPESDDLDRITKELLQINVDANGKVRMLSSDSSDGNKYPTRESVLHGKAPSLTSHTAAYLMMNKTNNTVDSLDDVDDVSTSSSSSKSSDVAASSSKSPDVSASSSSSAYQAKTSNLLTGTQPGHTNYLNSSIDDSDIVNSVIKSVTTPQHVASTELEKQKLADRKANLAAPFYNRKNPIMDSRNNRDNKMTELSIKKKAQFSTTPKLNAMQDDLLREMFKSRTSKRLQTQRPKGKVRAVIFSLNFLVQLTLSDSNSRVKDFIRI